ncbi:hypothetical protein FGM00_12035 [Aggregatimonas sangjinii]|uniref:Uncharacterized protein n=1 Tax=Aggregatimonas sangjinii TaxID=2583587 RepID=A0A5B7SV52_9FLAO|nr:hypothetical protein [Aggregatimonas sangjinii]QCX00801.1 hypothetical protein FGM00_12035 [Aggregatimonas sangjinii]
MIHHERLKSFYVLVGLLLSVFFGRAQECTLDIGGKNHNTIVDIFQLNAEQQTTMKTLRDDLQTTQQGIEEEIQKLFNTHPQSTEAELIALSDKYKVLKEKMVNVSWESDKKLLETFNPKQYERYLSLCGEALRKPIRIIPVMYKDSISPE